MDLMGNPLTLRLQASKFWILEILLQLPLTEFIFAAGFGHVRQMRILRTRVS